MLLHFLVLCGAMMPLNAYITVDRNSLSPIFDDGSLSNDIYADDASEYTTDELHSTVTVIAVPLVLLGALLLGLSSLTFTLTSQRSFKDPSPLQQLQTEVDRIFNIYLNAMQDEECPQRLMCEIGQYSKASPIATTFIRYVTLITPEPMKRNMDVLQEAALEDALKCAKFKCKSPKIN